MSCKFVFVTIWWIIREPRGSIYNHHIYPCFGFPHHKIGIQMMKCVVKSQAEWVIVGTIHKQGTSTGITRFRWDSDDYGSLLITSQLSSVVLDGLKETSVSEHSILLTSKQGEEKYMQCQIYWICIHRGIREEGSIGMVYFRN